MTKPIGPMVSETACGYSPGVDANICGATPTLHGCIPDTFEDVTFIMACGQHENVLRALTDNHHGTENPCFDLSAYWLTRPDGQSFCYHPDAMATLHAELAAGATVHKLVAA
jgi:hypothetical protein